MDFTPINHIELVEGVPIISGRSVKVKMIVSLHKNGASVEEIMEQYSLNHAQVYAALSYYYDHKDAIDAVLREGDELARTTGIDASQHLAELRARRTK